MRTCVRTRRIGGEKSGGVAPGRSFRTWEVCVRIHACVCVPAHPHWNDRRVGDYVEPMMTQARMEVFVVSLQTLEQSPPPPMLIGSWQDWSRGQLVAAYAVANAQVVAKREQKRIFRKWQYEKRPNLHCAETVFKTLCLIKSNVQRGNLVFLYPEHSFKMILKRSFKGHSAFEGYSARPRRRRRPTKPDSAASQCGRRPR